jgi:hypothetical protein
MGGVEMVYVVLGLTILFAVSYGIYRTAKTESVGFKALVAWVLFAVLDVAALIGWALWSLLRSAPSS